MIKLASVPNIKSILIKTGGSKKAEGARADPRQAIPETIIRVAVVIVLLVEALRVVVAVAAEAGAVRAVVVVGAVALVVAVVAVVAALLEEATVETTPVTTPTGPRVSPTTPDKGTSQTPIRVIPLTGANRVKDPRENER